MKRITFIFFIFVFSNLSAQLVQNFGTYDTTFNVGKMRLVGITSTTAYFGVIYTLSNLWYKDKTSFHFFNDNSQWNQMDKMGHSVTSYQEGKVSLELLKWSGVNKKGWLILGGMSGFIFQFPIEVLDGWDGLATEGAFRSHG